MSQFVRHKPQEVERISAPHALSLQSVAGHCHGERVQQRVPHRRQKTPETERHIRSGDVTPYSFTRHNAISVHAASYRTASAFDKSAPVHDFAKKRKPNARGEPRLMAGATEERKLLGVGSTALLGAVRLRQFSAHFVTTYQLFWMSCARRVRRLSEYQSHHLLWALLRKDERIECGRSHLLALRSGEKAWSLTESMIVDVLKDMVVAFPRDIRRELANQYGYLRPDSTMYALLTRCVEKDIVRHLPQSLYCL
jgi:hypothetical protein